MKTTTTKNQETGAQSSTILPYSKTLVSRPFQCTHLKGRPGTWLQGQVGPNSSHYTASSPMWFILPDRDGLEQRGTVTTSEMSSSIVPIFSPTPLYQGAWTPQSQGEGTLWAEVKSQL